jgi:hypothetical protein
MGEGTTEVSGNGTDRLRLEILQTEAELSDTIHEIEARLSPAELKRKAVEKMKAAASAGIEKVKREGPTALAMPAALTAAAVGLLFLVKGRRKPRTVIAVVEKPQAAEPSGRSGFGYGAAGLALGAAIALLLPKAIATGEESTSEVSGLHPSAAPGRSGSILGSREAL